MKKAVFIALLATALYARVTHVEAAAPGGSIAAKDQYSAQYPPRGGWLLSACVK